MDSFDIFHNPDIMVYKWFSFTVHYGKEVEKFNIKSDKNWKREKFS